MYKIDWAAKMREKFRNIGTIRMLLLVFRAGNVIWGFLVRNNLLTYRCRKRLSRLKNTKKILLIDGYFNRKFECILTIRKPDIYTIYQVLIRFQKLRVQKISY